MDSTTKGEIIQHPLVLVLNKTEIKKTEIKMLLVTPNQPVYNINKNNKNKSEESIHLWFVRFYSSSWMNECRTTVQMLAQTVHATRVWC